ncbi:MAG TPA: mechanosensitive ion channel family protein [Acidobacteriaceae bacterium]|nr:mechanosensitive ion channel family protein [Acidobacteriaceae bacterium]
MRVLPKRLHALILLVGAFALLGGIVADGQSSTPTPTSFSADSPNNEVQVLNHVNSVLQWGRRWDAADAYAVVPSDELFIENGQDMARQVVDLEFKSALAQAGLLANSSNKPLPPQGNASGAISVQNLAKVQQNVDQKLTALKTALDTINKEIPTARPKARPALQSRRDTLQAQLALAQALQSNLQRLTAFVNATDAANGVATELTAKILALRRTVPTAAVPAESTTDKSTTKSAATSSQIQFPIFGGAPNEGLVGQMVQLIHLVSGLHSLDQLKDETTRLQTTTERLRAPLLAALRSTLQQGRIELESNASSSTTSVPANGGEQGANSGPNNVSGQMASQSSGRGPVTPDGSQETPEQRQRATDELVRHFKQLSDATIPLSQELILMDQSQANLKQLQDSVDNEYDHTLRSLLLRVATLLIALGLIWLFSELWRRATFRYIRDARRRRQFLVLRRVITGFCMFVVILLGFVSDFSSLATYAGLITAGVAVALQTVILSVAAYFFLVGRYGVRVGDRVTVAYSAVTSVTGDVVDIGLVRFYLMELAGSGIDLQPTGRIVVFPNSVLFQTNPLFKQFPGTEYMWREIGFPMRADSDVALAEKELLASANKLYAEYKPALERQHAGLEQSMGMHIDPPKPYARLRLIATGLEVVVSYPVPLRQASAMDDRMVAAVMDILRTHPSIHLVDGAAPALRSTIKM